MKSFSAQQVKKRVQEDYNITADSFAKSRDRLWPELKFLFDYSKKKEKILDLGCGNGRFSQYLENTCYAGVDFSEELIKQARERFPNKHFQQGDALNLPFADNTFDKVYSIAMIHQIPGKINREKALEEIRRVTKKNGTAFLTVWNIKKNDKVLKNNKTTFFRCTDDSKNIIDTIKELFRPRNFFLKQDRYYYIFKKGELANLAKRVEWEVLEEGVVESGSRGNFYVILRKD